MTAALLIVGAYLLGSVSPSVLLGRAFKGVDLREHGSGNAGTTNAFRVLGNGLGLAVLAADILKGFIPVILAREVSTPTVTVVVALAAIAGHNWSIFMRGKGGKGVATGAGTLLAMMPLTFVFLVVVFAVVLLSTSRVSLASLTAALLLIPSVIATGKPRAYLAFSFLGVAFVVYAHRANIRRLLRGQETKTALSWTALGRRLRKGRVAPEGAPHMSHDEDLIPRGGKTLRVAVIGAGSWGTAMARHFGLLGLDVRLLGRREDQAQTITRTGRNPTHLREAQLPPNVRGGVYTVGGLEDVDLLVMAVPSKVYAAVAASLTHRLPTGVAVLSLTKGVEPGSLRRFSELLADLWSHLEPRIAILSGPNHAEEVSLDQPTATVLSSLDLPFAESLQRLLSNEHFRAYVNHDLVGVELASAVKNIIAVATGMGDGMGYGDNARAALITRGIAEMARLGIALGAEPLTFAGLAGLGDLVATCTSRHSRNRLAGELIARGHSPGDIESEMGMVAEGLTAAPAILALAGERGIEMPITESVVAVVHGGKAVGECVSSLMLREPRTERH